MLPHGGVQQWRGTLTSAAEDVLSRHASRSPASEADCVCRRFRDRVVRLAARGRHLPATARHRCPPLRRSPDAADRATRTRFRPRRPSPFASSTAGTREAILDLTSPTPDGKGMTVTGVTSDGGAVPIEHRDNRLHLPMPPRATAGQDVTFTISLPRRARPMACCICQQHPRRSHGIQRELVQPRAPVAADDRSSRRQGHGRVDRHDEGRLPGRVERRASSSRWICPADCAARTGSRTCRSRRGSTRSASRASSCVRETSCAACRSRSGRFRRTPTKGWRRSQRDARESFEFFSDRIGPYAYAQAGARRSGGHGRRHRAREQHLLRREERDGRQRAGGARDRASMVRRCGDRERLERRVAERGLRDLLHAALHRIRTAAAMRSSTACAAAATPCFDSRSRCRTRRWCTPTLNEASTEPNNRLVYEKGAWTLHMLRDLVGTEPFWRGIRLYYQRYMNGLASTADLRRAMEEVSGQDLRLVLRRSG